MSSGLNYSWRLAATGVCFAIFSIGGLILSTFVFPALLLTPRKTRAMRARKLIHKCFGWFIGLMESAGIMRFEVIGAERLSQCRNTLVLANHPTLIDVVALISLMPMASCVIKDEVWKNPFFSGVVRAANYISNSDPESLIADCSADLAAGNSLIIFPEGTRSQPGQPLHFLRGAAYIALRSGMPVLPVLIYCTPSTLTKQERWYQIPERRFHLRVEVLAPLPLSRWTHANDPPAIAARRLTRSFEAHFIQELEAHGRFANSQA